MWNPGEVELGEKPELQIPQTEIIKRKKKKKYSELEIGLLDLMFKSLSSIRFRQSFRQQQCG